MTYSRRETSPPGFLVPLLFTLRRFLFHFVAHIDTAPSLNEFSSSGQPTSSVKDSKRTNMGRYISGVVRYTYEIVREGTIVFGNLYKRKFTSKTNLYVKLYRFVIRFNPHIKLYFMRIFYIKKLMARKIKYFQRVVECVECLCSTGNFSIKIFSPRNFSSSECVHARSSKKS